MKKNLQAIKVVIICLAFSSITLQAAIRYWDVNGTTDGSGQGTGDGTWVNTQSVWNDDSTGGAGGTITTWPSAGNGDTAVFSAGTDATDAFTITVGTGAPGYIAGYNNITFEEGAITIKGSTLNAGSDYGYLYAYDNAGANTAGADATIDVQSGASVTMDIFMGRTAPNLVKKGSGKLTIGIYPVGFSDTANSYLKIEDGTWSAASYNLSGGAVSDSALGRAKVLYLGAAATAATLEQTGGGTASIGSGGSLHTAVVIGDAGATVSLPNGGALSFRCAGGVSGTGGLTIAGTGGTVRIGASGYGAGTWAGDTVVNAGMTLQNGNYDALPFGATAGNLTLNGTLDVWGSGTAARVNGLSGSGTVLASGGTGTLRAGDNDATSTFSGDIGNSASFHLVKLGNGTLTLTGANTLTGNVTNSGGTLVLSGSGSLGGAASFTVEAGSTLDVSGVSSPPYTLSSSQPLTATTGAGTTAQVVGPLTLAAGEDVTVVYASGNPSVNISSGELAMNANDVTIEVTGGALGSGTSYTLISKSGTGSVTGTVGSYSITGDGVTGGGTPSLAISGDQLVLTMGAPPPMLHWGPADGTWSVGAAGWESGGTTTFADGDVAIFDETYGSGTPTITVSGTVLPAQVWVTNDATATHYTLSGTGTIGGYSGISQLIKAGAGTLTIGVANALPAGLLLAGGQLNINSTTALGAASSTFIVAGSTIDNTSGGPITIANNNPQTWDDDLTFVGSNDLNLGTGAVTMGASRTVTANGSKLTVGGVISGSGLALTKAGSGTLELGGANTYSGETRVEAGVLVVANGNALQNSTLNMLSTDTGTVVFGPSITTASFGGLKGDDVIPLGRDLPLTNSAGGAVTLSVGANNASTAFHGSMSGAGAFTKTGTGTFSHGAGGAGDAWTYEGDTTISQGVLQLSANDKLPFGSGKGNLIVNGQVHNEGRTVNINGLSGTGTLNSSGTFDHARWTIGNNNASGSFSGVITRTPVKNMSVYKVGTGTQVLSGANAIGTVDGLVVQGGRVVGRNPGAFGSFRCAVINDATVEMVSTNGSPVTWDATMSLILSNTATVVVSGGSTITYSKSGNPSIGAGASVTLATETAADTLSIGSAVSDGDATALMTVPGPGTVALTSGSGTGYNGKWRLTGGTLRTSNLNSLGNSSTKAIELAGGTLEGRVTGTGAYSTATTVSSSSAILPNQAGAGVDHGFGTLSINGSTLTVGPGAQITGGTEIATFGDTTLTGSATFEITNSALANQTVVLAAVSESGGAQSLTKSGAGRLDITGASTYTGNTLVSGGSLLVTGSGSLAPESTVTVNSGATLGGTGTINGPVVLDSGSTLSPGASVGTLTVNSNLTLSGNLFIELDKSLSPSNDVVVVTGILTNAGTGTLTVTNLGPALAGEDTFKLFSQPVLNGQALTIVSAGPEVWTNMLALNGSIAVVPTAPPVVPATNVTIAAAGPNTFSLGALGAANSAYDVYASTNVTTPMSNWWLIGTTNSDGGGVIQFLDPQATNDQRFYRFGQTVTP